MRLATLALAGLAALAAAGAPRAQPAADYLPRDPGIAPAALPEPDAPVPAPVPLAPAGGDAAFVLRGIELEGASALTPETLRPLWTPLLGQPVSLATLDALAEQVTAAYRSRGYFLSQALLPEQTVTDGTVRIQVVEGFLGRVAVEGGTPGQQAAAARLFAPSAARRPLDLRTLERSVLLARDTFGGGVETVVEPSPDTFGAADLTVLLAPDRFVGFAAADNRGSRLYGTATLSAGGSAFDLLGANERLDALLALAPEDTSLAYGQLALGLPLPALAGTWLDGARLELQGDISRGEPDLSRSGSPDDLTVTSNETNLAAGLAVPFVRTRSRNLTASLGLDWQSSESVTGFAGGEQSSTDRLLVLRARVSFDQADRFGGVTLVDAALRQGLDAAGAEIGAEGPAAGVTDFTAATLEVSRLQRLGSGGWSLYLEAIGQLAADVLPNSERFGLGNSTIGRGFAPGNTSGDSGWGARAELRRAIAAGETAAEAYAFVDRGEAYDRSPSRDGATREPLGSFGVGARIDLRPWLTLTPEIARQTDGIATDTTDPDLETRAFLGVVARF
jgi:hemolysin activation/secretion protein